MVIPSKSYDIDMSFPKVEPCKCKEDDFCSCYYPPDEDFAYQELDHIIQQAIE